MSGAVALVDVVDAAVVTELTQAVWASFVDDEVELDEAFEVPSDADLADALVGRIAIEGPAAAVVQVVLPEAAARAAASRMLALDPDDVDEADVADATGEITNMVGGNLKAVLVGEHRLGLPAVTRGTSGPRAGTVLAPLWWGEHLLLVRVDALPGADATAVPHPRHP
ncbi:chemotaxis protein CheX [Aquipuribacter nitratireducens]|uniref:Chemotaxis protein CheX n=1 Tax=Aquipuribacter nitratireducens TaxID=650104 RepID=A0ABW0GN48_9MICO